MGREYSRVNLTCRKCGQTGVLEVWDDDWRRWDVSEKTGFKGRVYFGSLKADTLFCERCGETGPETGEPLHYRFSEREKLGLNN